MYEVCLRVCPNWVGGGRYREISRVSIEDQYSVVCRAVENASIFGPLDYFLFNTLC